MKTYHILSNSDELRRRTAMDITQGMVGRGLRVARNPAPSLNLQPDTVVVLEHTNHEKEYEVAIGDVVIDVMEVR